MKDKLSLDKIKNDAGLRDEFIVRYSNFILSSASKVSENLYQEMHTNFL